MHKTTVYLSDQQVEGLRRLAAAGSASQADLIRQGVTRILTEVPEREFHSMGKGRSSGQTGKPAWSSKELYEKSFGQPPKN